MRTNLQGIPNSFFSSRHFPKTMPGLFDVHSVTGKLQTNIFCLPNTRVFDFNFQQGIQVFRDSASSCGRRVRRKSRLCRLSRSRSVCITRQFIKGARFGIMLVHLIKVEQLRSGYLARHFSARQIPMHRVADKFAGISGRCSKRSVELKHSTCPDLVRRKRRSSNRIGDELGCSSPNGKRASISPLTRSRIQQYDRHDQVNRRTHFHRLAQSRDGGRE